MHRSARAVAARGRRRPTRRAGEPAQISPGPTVVPFMSTAPAAMTAPSPMVQPGRITAMRPTVTPRPMRVGAVTSLPPSAAWHTRVTSPPMTLSSPTSRRFWSATTAVLNCTRRPTFMPMSRWYQGRKGVTRIQLTKLKRIMSVSALKLAQRQAPQERYGKRPTGVPRARVSHRAAGITRRSVRPKTK